jgi:hypothetical protein
VREYMGRTPPFQIASSRRLREIVQFFDAQSVNRIEIAVVIIRLLTSTFQCNHRRAANLFQFVTEAPSHQSSRYILSIRLNMALPRFLLFARYTQIQKILYVVQ